MQYGGFSKKEFLVNTYYSLKVEQYCVLWLKGTITSLGKGNSHTLNIKSSEVYNPIQAIN